MNKDLKILFIYPNVMLQNTIPLNIALLSACLKKEGFNNIKLFDTTLYRTQEISGDEIRAHYLQFREWDFSSAGVYLKETNVFEDFAKTVQSYNPDLIAVTMVENTYQLAMQLLDRAKDLNRLTIAGGVFPTFSPNLVISHDNVDMICIGEGEKAMVDLCLKLSQGKDYSHIPNLWVKTKDGIVKNPLRKELTNLNELPFLDFTLFDEKRFYRPNRGKLFKTFPIETTRGCPYSCTYCCAHSWAHLYNNEFYREKDMSRAMEELKYQKEQFGMEFVYFSAETFLAMTDRRFDEFIEMYQEVNLPSWFQTRPETIRRDRFEKLLRKGFDFRLSVGIESGSEKKRRSLLNRHVSNKKIIEAIGILNSLNVRYGVNNMIGFPDETKKDIFETIGLNKQCNVKDTNVFIFVPFRGTKLHKICVEKGYIPPDHIATREHTFRSTLNMPQISSEEIYGLFRTFPLYVKMPEDYWPKIKRAEKFDEEGDKIYAELAQVHRNKYLK